MGLSSYVEAFYDCLVVLAVKMLQCHRFTVVVVRDLKSLTSFVSVMRLCCLCSKYKFMGFARLHPVLCNVKCLI